MKDFLDKDFLLESDVAKKLFHDYAEKMPICDYHCHLSPKEIYENNQPNNISDLWLSGDHYKWRAMRSCGVEEKYCTGDASPKEKFEKFAYTLQYCIGNPLYHWAHIELQRYFKIDTPLNAMPISIKVMAKSAALSPVLGLFGFSFSFTGVLSGLFTGGFSSSAIL